MTISTLPITAFPQNYSPLACSDDGRVAIETDETNNRQASATRVNTAASRRSPLIPEEPTISSRAEPRTIPCDGGLPAATMAPAELSVLYDREGRALIVWFSDRHQEHVCEETGEEVVLMKDAAGRVIGFKKLNFSVPETDRLRVAIETTPA